MSKYVTPNQPRNLVIQGTAVNILMDAAGTGGLFGMIETIVPSGSGPPAHTHSREDETFCVVEGTAEFRLGDEKSICGPGSVVYGPRGVTHGYLNVGETDLKITIVYTPGGVEESFQEWANTDDPEKVKEIIASYGVTLAE
jgi:quercetin dioxygenase-like cupin family protein